MPNPTDTPTDAPVASAQTTAFSLKVSRNSFDLFFSLSGKQNSNGFRFVLFLFALDLVAVLAMGFAAFVGTAEVS